MTGRTVRWGWLGEAWRLFLAQAGVWLGVSFLLLALSALLTVAVALVLGSSSGAASSRASHSSASDWIFLLGWDVLAGTSHLAVTSLLSGGLYAMATRQVRGEPIRVRDVFCPGRAGLRLPAFCLVWGASVGVGLVFFVVPGLLLAALLLPAFALIADGAGVFEAMARSLSATARRVLPLLALMLLLTVLLTFAVPPCLLGLPLVQPLLWLLSPLVARDLTRLPDSALPDYGLAAEGVWPPPPTVPGNPTDKTGV